MRDQPLILIVDDHDDNREILEARLGSRGYATASAVDGEDALAKVAALVPDLILLDVMMPKLDGLEVCRRLRADPALPFIPIVLVTAKAAVADVVAGLDAGADDYLTKPVEHAALVARVRSMLRIKALQDEVQGQKAELADWNQTLQARVAAQVDEIGRMSRLRRFLPPQVADLVVSEGGEDRLRSHRAEITVLFADLRGFTAFAERSEPETVMGALGAYHELAGPLINRYEGTLERFLGDGIMVLFNDPVPCPDPEARAVRLAEDLRAGFAATLAPFQQDGASLGLGIGIAQGQATIGQIGFEGRFDYSAIGPVSNLASRLCDQARDGEILIGARTYSAVAALVDVESLGGLKFKGIERAIQSYRVLGLRTP